VARIELDDLFPPGIEAGAVLAAAPLARIDALAAGLARSVPAAWGAAEEIRSLVGEAGSYGPSRDEILEAVERVCGDDLSGICATRIADAVARLIHGR
jgi:hypothetical protein